MVSQWTHPWRFILQGVSAASTPLNCWLRKTLHRFPSSINNLKGSTLPFLFFFFQSPDISMQEYFFSNNRPWSCHCFQVFFFLSGVWQSSFPGRKVNDRVGFECLFLFLYPRLRGSIRRVSGWFILDNRIRLQEVFLSFLPGCPYSIWYSLSVPEDSWSSPKNFLSLNAAHNQGLLIIIIWKKKIKASGFISHTAIPPCAFLMHWKKSKWKWFRPHGPFRQGLCTFHSTAIKNNTRDVLMQSTSYSL